jgi:hypothetical protein
MNEFSWNAIKRLVYNRAQGCCEYCQTCEANTGQAMHVEHIDPSAGDLLENLCLSCSNCNLSKGKATTASDPQSAQSFSLFNPRIHTWIDHFEWIDRGLRVRGLTAIGRATVERLKMNQERVIISRRRWAAGGFHPPI